MAQCIYNYQESNHIWVYELTNSVMNIQATTSHKVNLCLNTILLVPVQDFLASQAEHVDFIILRPFLVVTLSGLLSLFLCIHFREQVCVIHSTICLY